MTASPARPSLARRLTSGALAFLIGFGPMTPLALAAPTKLADGPINININAHPNIVFTLDDSTSMMLEFLPDDVVLDAATNVATSYCRSTGSGDLVPCGNTGSATIPQYHYATWMSGSSPSWTVLGAPGSFPYPSGYGSGSDGPPIVMASAFNAMFYNPTVTYTAPLYADKTSYPDMNAANTTDWTKVPADPYLFPTKYANLQTKVNVGVWCNTTYAGNFTLPNGATADRNGISIGGDYCRVNGFAYTVGANGAPKTLGDYSYPFVKVAADADNSKFFATRTRTIWCDPDRMNGSMGSGTGERAPGAPTCETCTATCPVPQVEDPSSPPGCDLGCTNPSECTKCNLKCPVDKTYSCGRTCTTPALNCVAVGGGNYPSQTRTCDPGPNQRCVTHPGACATTGAWTPDSSACNTKIKGGTYSKVPWTPSPGTVLGTTTYEQDANLNGDVCRRNNFTYSDGVAGGWKYPSGRFTKSVGSCGSIYASINRHYYKAMVQWCNARISTSTNDKWRGYGAGTCQAEKTKIFKYPRFFKEGAYRDADFDITQDNYGDNTAFRLVELDYKNKMIIEANGTPGTSVSHTVIDEDGNAATITRDSTSATPAASELVNYANWFAYYRSRILAAKSVTSLAFSELTDKFRVGFHTLSNVPATTFLTLADFKAGTGNQRELWYKRLTDISIPMGNDTPLLSGVARIGEWFNAASGTSPELSGSTDPINLSCQKNYHMLFTDGYTNQPAKPTALVGNRDGVPVPPKGVDDLMPEDTEFAPGANWPYKIIEGPTAVADSLSDYSLYYWMKDLRPPSFPAKVSDNNVQKSEDDPATWQHLNFAAISLGTEGELSSFSTKNTESQLASGALRWTTPNPVNRPGVRGVDDLWHAAIAGRSQFVNARDPAELQSGMASILNEVIEGVGTRSAAGFSAVNFAKTDNFSYRTSIEKNWGGTLTKSEIEPTTGVENPVPVLKYHEVLAAQLTPTSGNPTPWFDSRNVITWDPVARQAVPFRLGSMPTAQSDTLGSDNAMRAKVIAYLRGDRSNEGKKTRNFRERSLLLGDIVNSSPVVVGPSKGQYSDATDPGYEAFKAANASRKKMVYVGSNDGMLHAFDEATGQEVWAYVPSTVYSSDPDAGLGMLAKKVPFFKHQMFVDATPVAVDVNVGGTWKTLLIGGVGKGGKSYYAIDVTNPASVTSEATAAAKVLWEFTDSDMGYTFGKPLIGKTYADNTWVAVFPAGYNNASGKGKLFFVRLSDGELLRTLETTAGSASDPSGLAQVSGFVLSYKNQFIEQIYGGDLLGNVWRFDVSSADTSNWKVEKLATLTSTDSTAQSVTTAPQIEVDFANGVDRYVMVGTGRLLHEDDLATYGSQVQTMYVIRDGTVLKMNDTGLPHKPRTDGDFTSISSSSTSGMSGLSVKGWYMDLPVGERIVAPIAAELNIVGWAGSRPPENECLPGLSSNVYVRDFPHADSQLVDSGGNAVSTVEVAEGAVGMEFVNLYSETPNDPTLKLAITLGTNKVMFVSLKKGVLTGDHRMSWRLMGH